MNPRSKGLGRLFIPDERDRSYLMAAPRVTGGRYFRNWLVPGPVRDQGEHPHCVGFAIEAYLRAHPIVNAHTAELEMDPAYLYHEAQKVDEWPGENYAGTSVRAGFKVLQRMGLVERYTWAFDAVSILRHVLTTGPVVVGTLWTADMEFLDPHGYIAPTGYVWGGHGYLITGGDAEERNPDGSTGRLRIQNSWGEEWGDDGRAWITVANMQKLMAYDGEACTAIEKRVRPEEAHG